VSFVNGERAHVHAPGQLHETRRQQPLGRNEQQSITARGELIFDPLHFVQRHAAIQGRGRVSALAEPVDLILHQRNER
jgi:hypothetical protein